MSIAHRMPQVNSGGEDDKHGNSYRDALRIRKRQGMIWRAIGNFALNDVPVYWITLSSDDKTLDWIDKRRVIHQEWLKLRRKWRYANPDKQYAFIASGGESGRNPHYHLLSTAPLPNTWSAAEVDVQSKIVGQSPEDRKFIARYCEFNLSQDAPFTHQNFRTSQDFEAWSNSAIFHLFCDLRSSVTVYVHNVTKSTKNHTATPTLKECRFCGNRLPKTHNYFIRDGDRFRTECRHCNVLFQKAVRANRNNQHVGIVDTQKWVAYCLERRIGSLYRDDYDGQLIPIDDITLDHMNPLALGGANVLSNVCLTSAKHNQNKSVMPFDAWIRQLYALGIVNQWTNTAVDCRDVLRQKTLFDIA